MCRRLGFFPPLFSVTPFNITWKLSTSGSLSSTFSNIQGWRLLPFCISIEVKACSQCKSLLGQLLRNKLWILCLSNRNSPVFCLRIAASESPAGCSVSALTSAFVNELEIPFAVVFQIHKQAELYLGLLCKELTLPNEKELSCKQ